MIIFKKTILALTGLFICVFLVAHLGANFLLLLPHETARTYYNAYSLALRSNVFITVIAYINYACIVFHVLYALLITMKNRSARKSSYEINKAKNTVHFLRKKIAFLVSLEIFGSDQRPI